MALVWVSYSLPIRKSFEHAGAKFSTSSLNKILEKANKKHQAPAVGGRRPKLKYVHQSDVFPPTLTMHGNHLQSIPKVMNNF